MDTPMPRIAVVTGASRGLGKELARLLSHEGYNVITGQRSNAKSIEDVICNHARRSNIKSVSVDLNSNASIGRFAETLFEMVPYIDVLINNAAVCPPYPDDGVDDRVYWEYVMQVNFHAHVRITRLLLPLLQKSAHYPRVVNVSSGDGELLYFHPDLRCGVECLERCSSSLDVDSEVQRITHDLLSCQSRASRRDNLIFNGQPAYKLSKAALNVFTEVAARTLGRGPDDFRATPVSFVAVCPGDVETGMMDHDCIDPLSAEEAALRMWCVVDVSKRCSHNGMFVRYGSQIEW